MRLEATTHSTNTGHLGRFILEIPGTQILSSPCKITIEDLYLLVVPSAGRQHDPGEDERRMQVAKQERLDSYETLQAQSAAATQMEGDEKSQTAVEIAMTQRIADNLQVYVKNIHIRYEDDVSCPGHPFAAGITLGSFQVETTDKNWLQAFITEKLQSIELHKVIVGMFVPRHEADSGPTFLNSSRNSNHSPFTLTPTRSRSPVSQWRIQQTPSNLL